MQTFDFPHFRWQTRYPESGTRFQFGRSWTYAVPPDAPDQRIFILKFPALKWIVDAAGTLDLSSQPEINLGRLDKFYRDHKLYADFNFPHPAFGMVVCKFNKPLEIPEGEPGGDGAVLDLEIELVEQP